MKNLILALVFITQAAIAQKNDSIDLFAFHKLAIENYPIIKQKALLENSLELRLKNQNTNYLPQLYLNGQASYQSAVTEIPIHIPGITIPEPYKDNYKITLDINQSIYDGGFTKKQKEIDKANLNTDKQNIEVDLYKIKERINQLYFSVLLYQENEKILVLSQSEIKSKLSKIESGVRNGISIESNANVLKSEILKIDQQLIEIQYLKSSFLEMIGEYINKKLPTNTLLPLPIIPSASGFDLQRQELKLFDFQKEKITASKSLISSKTMPKLNAFAQLGYGRPGLNMFLNDFDKFYIVGAKLSWNIWNWNSTKNEKGMLDIQSQIIDNQKEIFIKNLKVNYYKDLSEIQKYDEILKKDIEIIVLKTKIKETASLQLENGVISATDYVTEVNAEAQAKLNQQFHSIQKESAKINYLYNLGKL
ncbi:MAG: TolC family protein [Bacteroidetes bacterium]|nr:TolC family protein [Bacteroidota bacterium]